MCRLYFALIVLGVILSTYLCHGGLNIALHAQVHPDSGKVVGSVITTDGLRAAFSKRGDVSICSVFHPFRYHGFSETQWDLIVIEGWFPSMTDFLRLARTQSPQVVILFYCLDPEYPGLQLVRHFEVDGFLTNSRAVQAYLSEFAPTEFCMLAADEEKMSPRETSREHGAVYIGAGGAMLQHKPNLLSLLTGLLPLGLRLHGSSWESVSELRGAWRGVLPQNQIAEAYSSAHVVIAATIESQAAAGMINNRVFEALSCGSIVLSEPSAALLQVVGDVILYVHSAEEAQRVVRFIMNDDIAAASMRARSRSFILSGHTWRHRTVTILSFFHTLRHRHPTPPSVIPYLGAQLQPGLYKKNHATYSLSSSRGGPMPRLLWLVEDAVWTCTDYAMVVDVIRQRVFSLYFEMHVMSETEWNNQNCSLHNIGAEISASMSCDVTSWLEHFDLVVVVAYPWSALERQVRALSVSTVPSKGTLQRLALYAMGYDQTLSAACAEAQSPQLCNDFSRYDLVMFRDFFEVSSLARAGMTVSPLRLQQVFGSTPLPDASSSQGHVVVVCFIAAAGVCSRGIQQALIGEENNLVRLLLLGGSWDAWMGILDTPDLLNEIVHISGERYSTAISTISTARVVYVCNNPISPDDSTRVDELWPMTAALTSEVPVVMLSDNPHLMQASESMSAWTFDAAVAQTRHAIDRIFGLALSMSRIEFSRVPWLYNHIPSSTPTPTATPTPTSTPAPGEQPCHYLLVFELSLLNFVPGRDGDVCFQVNSKDSFCLITSVRHVILTIPVPQNSPDSCTQVDVKFYLHGIMFLDELFSSSYSAQVCAMPFVATEEALRHFPESFHFQFNLF